VETVLERSHLPLALRVAESCLRSYSRLTPTGRGGYRLVRALRRFYPGPLRSGSFRIPGGTRMRLDLGAYPDCTMAFGLYELETVRIMRKLLRPGDTFVDAGANIGYFATLAAGCVGPTGRVHAFEPCPANRERLSDNVGMNRVTEIVRIHPQALSDYNGPLPLHMYANPQANHGQATAFPRAGHQTRTVTATAARLDELLPDLAPRLIKLDVEGSELAALKGMAATLKRARPALIIEFNPVTFKEAGTSAMELVRMLAATVPEYRCWALRWPVRPLDPSAAQLERLGEVNLLFELPARLAKT
jgi:FkbM family methyltransferase